MQSSNNDLFGQGRSADRLQRDAKTAEVVVALVVVFLIAASIISLGNGEMLWPLG